jgi:arylsulfatase A
MIKKQLQLLLKIKVFVILSLMILSGCTNWMNSSKKPNIIFILADDLGYGDLGCYGQKTILTPNIDKLAMEGMRFTQAYAGSTVCAPSRCALMTGYHTGKAIIRNNGVLETGERINLPDSSLTVAELLKSQGYVTGLFGKWGLGEPGTEGIPNNQGFDEFYGFLNQGRAHQYYVDYAWHNEEKVHFPENARNQEVVNVAEWYFKNLKEFIKNKKNNPFFIYYACTLPHAELRTTVEDIKPYLNDNGESKFDEIPFKGKNRYRPTNNPYATYAGMVSQLDRHVGELEELLKNLDLESNTIVFFTSDNGPHKEGGYEPEVFDSNGELRGIKRDLYEGGIRVPLIVKWPGNINQGTESNYIWANWDFLPTVADLINIDKPAGIDGVSVVPVLKGEKIERSKPLYWEFLTPARDFRMAVRDGKWKGVVYSLDDEMQLYDLEKDPSEEDDLAQQFPDKVEALKNTALKTRTPSEYWPVDENELKKFLTGK